MREQERQLGARDVAPRPCPPSPAEVGRQLGVNTDRRSRAKAADLVEALFISRRLTNWAFEKQFPHSSDPALEAIEDTLWCHYDDYPEGKLEHVPEDVMNVVLRCIAFLRSDVPYSWPKVSYPGAAPEHLTLLDRLTDRLHLTHRRKNILQFMEHGDLNCWPFSNRDEMLLSRRSY